MVLIYTFAATQHQVLRGHHLIDAYIHKFYHLTALHVCILYNFLKCSTACQAFEFVNGIYMYTLFKNMALAFGVGL